MKRLVTDSTPQPDVRLVTHNPSVVGSIPTRPTHVTRCDVCRTTGRRRQVSRASSVGSQRRPDPRGGARGCATAGEANPESPRARAGSRRRHRVGTAAPGGPPRRASSTGVRHSLDPDPYLFRDDADQSRSMSCCESCPESMVTSADGAVAGVDLPGSTTDRHGWSRRVGATSARRATGATVPIGRSVDRGRR